MLFVLLSLSSNIFAATQGAPGSNSTGSVEISVVVDQTIRILGLVDFNFGLWNTGDPTPNLNSNVCIGKTDVFGPYAIRAAGDGNSSDPSAFTLSNGVDQINYNVYWNDEFGLNDATKEQLTPGLILHNQTGIWWQFIFNRFACFFPNANVQVEIPTTELQSASGGNYSGTLTLLVIPD